MSRSAAYPVKWMSPEMLRDGISTEKSDVWAFGVTSWEVFSIGGSPYPGVENHDMLKHLDQGLRLEQPCLCRTEISAGLKILDIVPDLISLFLIL
ncbi:hypothetical protein EMCRGX_G002909 [Ephydatia muelleri]